MALDFGLIYEVMIPKPFTPGKEQKYFQACVDQVKLADKIGYSHVWHVEHHFLTEYAHSSAPDAMLGAYAAVTKNIRLGFGVKLLPFNYNHPLRCAEAASTLDVLSGGRVDFGTGRSATRTELEGFGITPNVTRQQWREALEMIVKAWRDEDFSWESDNFSLPARDVIPKPVQKPHPPLWMATTAADSHVVAGEAGLGCLSFTLMVELEELARRLEMYYTAVDNNCTPIGESVNRAAATFTLIHCAETDEDARQNAAAAQEWYVRKSLESVARTAQWAEEMNFPNMPTPQKMAAFDLDQVKFDYMDDRNMCIVGDPDTCIRKVKEYEAVGCTQLLGNHQAYGIPLAKVKKSIELFGKHVIPEFADFDGP